MTRPPRFLEHASEYVSERVSQRYPERVLRVCCRACLRGIEHSSEHASEHASQRASECVSVCVFECLRVTCPSYASRLCARAMFPFSTLLRNCDSQRNFQVALPSYASEHVTARASKMSSRAVLLSYASEPCLRAMLRNAVSNILSSALGGSRGARIHLEETWRHRCIRMPPSPPCHFNVHWSQNTRRENLRKRAGDMNASEIPKTLRPP